jgi:hypothetical protein
MLIGVPVGVAAPEVDHRSVEQLGVGTGQFSPPRDPLWFGGDPAIQTYIASMKKYEPSTDDNSNGPLSWTAGVVFGAAAKAGITAGTTPTSADILKGLYSLGPNYTAGGLMPPTTCAVGKPAVQSQGCDWYATLANGAFTTPMGTARSALASCIPC